jgi:transcriptional regulator with XRE-family HTH domain
MKNVAGPYIRKLRDSLKMRRKDFADAIGIGEKHLDSIERGVQRVPDEVILRISQRFRTSPNELFGFDDIDRSARPSLDEAFVDIPRLDAIEGAAPPAERVALPRAWLRRLGLRPDDAAAAIVDGPEMEPWLQQGELAVFNRADTEIRTFGVYAIADPHGPCRIRRLATGPGGELVVEGGDPRRPQHDVYLKDEADQVTVLGRVVWSAGEWPAPKTGTGR